VERLAEIKRGFVSVVGVVSLAEDRHGATGEPQGFFRPSNDIVTAMRDSEDKLRLIVWRVSDAGTPEPRAVHATEETIKAVAITRVAPRRVVTALRDSDDKLRLIIWDISSDGRTVSQLGLWVGRRIHEVQAVGMEDFTVAKNQDSRLLTAARDWDGNLFVADWKISAEGEVKSPHTEVYGPASGIDLSIGQSGHHFHVAAMRDEENELRLIAFHLPEKRDVTRGGFGTGGRIRQVRSTSYSFADPVFTATVSKGPIGIRTGPHDNHRLLVDTGLLKVIRWEHRAVSDSGGALINMFDQPLERSAEFEVGATDGLAYAVDIMNLVGGIGFDASLVTAHTGHGTFRKLLTKDQGKPELRVIAWSEDLAKTAQATLGGDYTHVEMAPLRPVGDSARFVTLLRGVRGELKLVVWGVRP
jgi:hypothetical protein